MSKVPYTFIDQYICTELENVRKMNENRDYSGLAASIERIQMHANAMESALHRYSDIKYVLASKVTDDKVTHQEFRDRAKEVLEELKK